MIAEWLVDVGVIAWLSDPFNSGYLAGVATVMLGAGLYSLARLPFIYRRMKRNKDEMTKKLDELAELASRARTTGANMSSHLMALPDCPACHSDRLIPTDMVGVIVEVACTECHTELHAICQEDGVSIGKIGDTTPTGPGKGVVH